MDSRTAHPYVPDRDAAADHTGQIPCRCGLPARNQTHRIGALAEAQAAHRARIGDRDEGDR